MLVEFIASGLAAKIIDLWIFYNRRRQSDLDREHQVQLQRAQRLHEITLENYRSNRLKRNAIPNIDGNLLNRLTKEAELLSAMSFDVVYELVGSGYGLALPISSRKILVLWVSKQYPVLAPEIYEVMDLEIYKMEFAPNTWRPHYTFEDIVLAMTEED